MIFRSVLLNIFWIKADFLLLTLGPILLISQRLTKKITSYCTAEYVLSWYKLMSLQWIAAKSHPSVSAPFPQKHRKYPGKMQWDNQHSPGDWSSASTCLCLPLLTMEWSCSMCCSGFSNAHTHFTQHSDEQHKITDTCPLSPIISPLQTSFN